MKRLLVLVPFLLLFATFSATAAGAGPAPSSDRAVYAVACAACHGMDGRGAAVDFEEELPDFSDCSFATREPDADWFGIAHSGGPTRAFSRMMPAFGKALSQRELQQALDHVRTFCPDRRWPRGELNLPRPLFTTKAFPEDEAVFTSTISTEGPTRVANKIIYETRIGPTAQIEVIAPFSYREGAGSGVGSEAGVGDVALAYKRALWHDLRRGSIFSAAAELILPTGDDEKGLGSGTTILEPFVAWGQILPRDSFLQAQLGAELPFDTDRAGREGFFRIAGGKSWVEGMFGRTWSPMLELLAARELTSGAAVHWWAVPQAQVTLSTRQHIRANVGLRIPLDDRDVRDTELAFYLLWDWFDGGLTEGW